MEQNSLFTTFFSKLGFNSAPKPEGDFQTMNMDLRDSVLQEKLAGRIFYYEPKNKNTHTSFYVLINNTLQTELDIDTKNKTDDVLSFRTYIWNQPNVDLYFIQKKDNDFELRFVQSYDRDILLIDSFIGKDAPKIAEINKTHFDTGLLWHLYLDKIEGKNKKVRIDEELRKRLKNLGKILNEKIKDDKIVVQAIIDRVLFIKFLEDRHILNSYFYNKFFQTTSFEELLLNNGADKINDLFKYIHHIFNQQLFDEPYISEDILNKIVDDLLKVFSKNPTKTETGQISLYPFRFDILPTEFIGHIYEHFLEGTKKTGGIFYTPKNLAELIVELTITHKNKCTTVLDPACGSGMFLILAFQKLKKLYKLDTKPETAQAAQLLIHKRCNLIEENIFGIEKEKVAQRLALFSMYLEIIRDIDPILIKEIVNSILKRVKENNDTSKIHDQVFQVKLNQNIICRNTLDLEPTLKPFPTKKFDFIIGNPPFTEKLGKEETDFWENFEFEGDKAKDIVGKKQLSQLFMFKVKYWAKASTRFGFVQNSSNFYNEESNSYREFFFEKYTIKQLFELSKIDDILFQSTKESVFATIFTNEIPTENHELEYYSPELSNFSKTFQVIVLEEDKMLKLNQAELQNGQVGLRDYLLGNEWDRTLIGKFNKISKSEQYIKTISVGLQIYGSDMIKKEFGIEPDNLSKQEKEYYKDRFYDKYTSIDRKNDNFIPFVKPSDIFSFGLGGYSLYIDSTNIDKLRRAGIADNFIDKKILFNRIDDSVSFVLSKELIYFNENVFCIKLKETFNNDAFYQAFLGILNSNLVLYYLMIKAYNRLKSNFANTLKKVYYNLPIPHLEDQPQLVAQISQKVQEIMEVAKLLPDQQSQYNTLKEEIDELVFELYDLDILEIQRIKDFFAKEPENKAEWNNIFEKYHVALHESLEMYFNNKLFIENYQGKNLPLKMSCTAIYFGKKWENENSENKAVLLAEIYNRLLESQSAVYLAQDFLFGENCIFILKENKIQNWTETKAFEDAQYIIKKLYRL